MPDQFAHRFSLEATRPNAAEIAALADMLPGGTAVYFSAVPTITPQELIAAAALLRKSGLEPIVHIAARRIPVAADLQDFISGPSPDALAVIQKGRLREAGIEEIGIGAYPEGHNRIAAGRLAVALDEKIATATAHGLGVHIVSQFSFSPERILAWLQKLRACGITKPVKVGMAGPTSVPGLMRYAKRCGVNASLRGLMAGAAAGLIGNVGPDRIVETLSLAGDLGDAAPHYFSFGGAVETARYACSTSRRLAAGRAMAQPNLSYSMIPKSRYRYSDEIMRK